MYSTTECNHHGSSPSPNAHATENARCQRGLSRAEERETAALIAGGDQAARNRMVLANLGLVVTIARKFQGRGLALDDLVGEGNLGLIRAAESFDPDFGTRFGTYAAYWVEEAIRDALLNRTATIRLPAYVVRLLTRWDRAWQSLHQRLEYPPSFDEVASHLGLSERAQKLVQMAQRTLRIKLASGIQADRGDSSFYEPFDTNAGPDDRMQIQEDREDLASRMRCLDEREQKVLESRFGFNGALPLTLKEVGKHMGLTREWISVIEKRAIKKLGSLSSLDKGFTGKPQVPA
jgi:RNA polymerase primary sigma factor